jgi:hypothetical protein
MFILPIFVVEGPVCPQDIVYGICGGPCGRFIPEYSGLPVPIIIPPVPHVN